MHGEEDNSQFKSFLEKVSGKKLIIFCTLIILALAGGFFYFRFIRLTPPEKWSQAPYSPAEDYKVVEVADTRRIVNKKAGISFDIPDGWRIREKHNNIYLLSPDLEEESPPPNMKGCLISPSVIYIRTNLAALEKPLNNIVEAYITEKNIVKVSSKESIQYKGEIEKTNFYKEGTATPINELFRDRVIVLSVESNITDKEQCSKSFENFLKTVSIE